LRDLQTVKLLDAKPINSVADIPSGMAIHGTNVGAWGKISTPFAGYPLSTELIILNTGRMGLSKMKRNHIHMAQGLPGEGVISGMRLRSEVLIYIDVEKALAAGLKFYLSSNGVVLSEGDARGFIRPEFFQKVTNPEGKYLRRSRSPSPQVDILEEVVAEVMSSAEDKNMAEMISHMEDLSP
jgi:2'-phosphotransferase